LKILKRIKNQGLITTFYYYLGTVFFERIGVEYTKIYKHDLLELVADDPNIKIVKTLIDLDDHIKKSLTESCSPSYLSNIIKKLNNGSVLAIGLVKGNLGSIAFLTLTNLTKSEKNNWFIHSCFTFPKYRGNKLYPRSINRLMYYLKNSLEHGNHQSDEVFIEASFANKASINGIEKCNFKKIGSTLRINNKIIWSSLK
jgi:hypothetical protein